ncbi:hypothetical protein G3I44_15940 [Halogeometricum borinquense]|uniref:Uncharacterized protein n=1 Tax=Halogeometricum borinquense TaxID=60847 RepID=A0A6C0UJE6_9EURY|nr:hypothetical protein [Halogeometricum borinquense]QIB75646.1 hypothetical protein G3I44_15940 [Halogeometricum borinquense]
MKVDIVDTLRQPEYTGENRCEPCTVLNLVIAALLGSFVARKSKLGGWVAVTVSVGLIYLRGYLIPGTPTLTKQYLPPTLLRWFGKDTEPDIATGFAGLEAADESTTGAAQEATQTDEAATMEDATTSDTDSTTAEQLSSSDDLEDFFVAHGILELCADADDLCLTDSFEAAWFEEIETLVDEEIPTEAVVDAFGLEDDDHQFDLVTQDEAHLLKSESRRIGQWPSRPALIADIAASRVLQSQIPSWDTYEPQKKGQILNSLRMFLETCPTTGGDIQIGEEVVESCCSTHKVFAVTCEETGERLFEHRVTDVEA